MSKLPRRLQIIASLVDSRNICDVGCDHGKLAEYLLRENKVDKVIVSDISMPSLQKAIELLSSKNYNFEYICCDGLSGYEGKDIEQCIIAGMGGDEIIKIISNSPIEIDSYILSPQHNNIEVKKFLLNKNYDIDYDIIIKDKGKFYNIIRFKKSDIVRKYSDYELLFGEANCTCKESDIKEFVECEINKVNNILSQNQNNENMIKYLELLKQYNKRN